MTREKYIYLDHAATSPLLPEAFAAMEPFLRENFGNPSSPHHFGHQARKAVEEARESIADCIGVFQQEIFFTSGGTEGNNWVLRNAGRHLLISKYEHHSVLNAALMHSSAAVDFVPPKKNGEVTPEKICRVWEPGVNLVSVMTANNEIGVVNPIAALCREAHRRGALFHTDAVQALGHIPVNAGEWGVDFLTGSAHKFGGPKGVGFLYAKSGAAPLPLLAGGDQERGCRAGTENVAGIVGMAVALRCSCERMEKTARHLDNLRDKLVKGLREHFPVAVFHCETASKHLPGLVSVALPSHPAEGLLHILDLKGFAVSAGAACDSRRTQVSHVLKALHIPKALAECTLRISLGAENTLEDIQAFLRALAGIS